MFVDIEEIFINHAKSLTIELIGMIQTELLSLAKKDYDSILKIQKTSELQERVQFLKVYAHSWSFFWGQCSSIWLYLLLTTY